MSSSNPHPPDAARFPLIRDLLRSFTPTSAWLSSPSVAAALRKHLPPTYHYASRTKTHIDATGRLVVWGAAEGEWRFCLRVEGLSWATLRSDLADLLHGHDVVDAPLVVGAEADFAALVYMRCGRACDRVIADLHGAEVARETVVRVARATEADLRRVLLVQGVHE